MTASVCMCVCLSVHNHIFGTTHLMFTKFFVHGICGSGSGSVLLWQRSDMLCTSGFMDDIISAHKPKLLSVATQLRLSPHVALRLAINGSLLAVDMHACCS